MRTSELASFAADAGVELVTAGTIEAVVLPAGQFVDDPRIDFGRLEELVPRGVLVPRDRGQLAACVRFLARARIPYKTRGAAHSSGGQVLIADGVVIDLRRLARIVSDDPSDATVTVEAGMWWLDLVAHLRPQGRRPRCVTANLRTTIGGTLAVGGFGDSSHVYGLQIAHVERMTVMTPDGDLRSLSRDDELFRWVLAGRGQLAIIIDVTLQTVRRSWTIAVREMWWRDVADYAREAAVLCAPGCAYDFVRARVLFKPRSPRPQVAALVGASSDEPRDPADFARLAPAAASRPTLLDLHTLLAGDPPQSWREPCPALEIVLPLPAGLAVWPELARRIAAAGIAYHQPLGPSVMIVRGDARFPLAPLPAGAPHAMMIALRPTLATRAEARALLPALRELGAFAVAAGARIYGMSVDCDTLADELGDVYGELGRLKRELDPDGLLNAGLLR